MKRKHIAIIVESAHGHINPTLGIASQLVSRGYDVSYAVKENFAPRVRSTGSKAVVYKPLENKLTVFRQMQENGGGQEYLFDFNTSNLAALSRAIREEIHDTHKQLTELYETDKPDLIMYDVLNMAGKSMATEWGIPTIVHSPMLIPRNAGFLEGESLVIVTLPRFFQQDADELDSRYRFVGPVFNDGSFFKPWKSGVSAEHAILVSASTGLLPSIEYFKTAVDAFRDCSHRVVLSIGDEIDPASLGFIPDNFEINQYSSQSEILMSAELFVGQGGALSIVEALRFGVPVVLCPPSQTHDLYARRAAELGLGVCIRKADFSASVLRESAVSVLSDHVILDRVREFKVNIQESRGAETAADLIESFIISHG